MKILMDDKELHMPSKLFTVCKKYNSNNYGEIHTFENCFLTYEEALDYLKLLPYTCDYYIEVITDKDSIIELYNDYFTN